MVALPNTGTKWLIMVVVGAATSALPRSARADDPDPWFGKDKALHFGASATIAIGGYAIGAVWLEERSSALALGGGLALTAGVGKELYDAAGHGTASGRDLVWDVAGTVTGLGVAWVVDLLLRGSLESGTSDTARVRTIRTSEPARVIYRF